MEKAFFSIKWKTYKWSYDKTASAFQVLDKCIAKLSISSEAVFIVSLQQTARSTPFSKYVTLDAMLYFVLPVYCPHCH